MKFKCLKNPGKKTVDFVITTVPWTDSSIPLMAPASLKPVIEKAGFSCLAVDVNAEVYAWTKVHPQQKLLLDFFFDEKLHLIV